MITNDDGIDAPGLIVAEKIASGLTKIKNNIFIIAPSSEQSGCGHGLQSYQKNMTIKKVGHNRFKLDGSPTDCILAGLTHIMRDKKPDIIISGVNKGHNISDSILYSGTVGAAIEGSLHRIRSIALSQSYSNESFNSPSLFRWSSEMGEFVCKMLLKFPNWETKAKEIFFNVNFPSCEVSNGSQLKVCGVEDSKSNPFVFKEIPNSGDNNQQFQTLYNPNKEENILNVGDETFLLNGYTTITPINPDMTHYQGLSLTEELVNDQ